MCCMCAVKHEVELEILRCVRAEYLRNMASTTHNYCRLRNIQMCRAVDAEKRRNNRIRHQYVCVASRIQHNVLCISASSSSIHQLCFVVARRFSQHVVDKTMSMRHSTHTIHTHTAQNRVQSPSGAVSITVMICSAGVHRLDLRVVARRDATILWQIIQIGVETAATYFSRSRKTHAQRTCRTARLNDGATGLNKRSSLSSLLAWPERQNDTIASAESNQI